MKSKNQLCLTAFQQNIRSFWKTYKKTFYTLLFIHIIAVSAIIRANVSYIDDVGRVAGGYRNFGFGRKLSDFLAILVHADQSARDVSPLTQLLAVCFLSAACCIVIHLLSEKREFDFWTIAAVLPLGLSPYFLECLSYKYDAPYMALSVLVSVLPFLFCEYGLLPYSVASVAGCLSMCTLYQSSSGIYPMLTALLCFRQWNRGRPLKDITRFGLVSVFSYCLALIIFRIQFALYFNNFGYVSQAVSLIKFPENLRKYFSLIHSDFKFWWLALIALIAVSFVFVSACDTDKKPRVLSGLLAAVTLLIMLLLSYGAYGFFEKPLTDPRAMYGFGVFIAFAGVCASGAKWRINPAKLACLCLTWSFFVFAFVYGNALAENQRYLEFRAEAAMRDVCETETFRSVEQGGESLRLQYYGSIQKSPILLRRDDNYNLLVRLVPNIVNKDWAHGQNYMRWYFGVGNYIIMDYSEDFRSLDLPVLKDTFYHTIRGDSERILIEFKH